MCKVCCEPVFREAIKELLGYSGYRDELSCHSTCCGEVTAGTLPLLQYVRYVAELD